MSSSFPLMIDSGAFSAWSKGTKIDLDAYIAFCHEILADHPQAICVNLDVIGEAKKSYTNWKRMKKGGINSLPVWHVEGDPEHAYLKRYLKQTNHIGIGAISQGTPSQRKLSLDRIWQDYLTDGQGMPVAKVHGMGITSFPLMLRYPWFSVDSTSWIKVAMFGHILQPKRRGSEWDYSCMPTKVGFSTRCSDLKNKDKHFDTMSPSEKSTLVRFLNERGFLLGESDWEIGKTGAKKGKPVEIPLVEGVVNNFGMRANLCMEFYANCLKTQPWPRAFKHVKRGFTHDTPQSHLEPVSGDIPYTIIYLSGSAYRGEDYVKENVEDFPHVGVLLSYIDLYKKGLTWRRLVDLIDGDVLCPCETMPSPHDIRAEHPGETHRDEWKRYKEFGT